jgi:CheY-like chemotaxis protein
MKERRLRLLLAEGNPGEVAAALHELYAGSDPGLDLTVVSTIATLLATIKVVDPEVILLDLALNLREPIDAVHLVHRTAPGVPLVLFADPAAKERVYLPALVGTLAESGGEKAPAPSLAEIRGTETILIVEDHESIREMARQTLLSMGYRVLSACDGQEALKLCAHETPALAILDVIMPNLGGPATAASLQQMLPELPLVFTSGYSADARDLPSAGGKARYLQKPYSPTTLRRLVRETLDHHHAGKHVIKPNAQTSA